MTDDAHSEPVIVHALQTRAESGHLIWNLIDQDGRLIGWTVDLPSQLVIRPGCFQYGTGDFLDVTYAPGFTKLEMSQQ